MLLGLAAFIGCGSSEGCSICGLIAPIIDSGANPSLAGPRQPPRLGQRGRSPGELSCPWVSSVCRGGVPGVGVSPLHPGDAPGAPGTELGAPPAAAARGRGAGRGPPVRPESAPVPPVLLHPPLRYRPWPAPLSRRCCGAVRVPASSPVHCRVLCLSLLSTPPVSPLPSVCDPLAQHRRAPSSAGGAVTPRRAFGIFPIEGEVQGPSRTVYKSFWHHLNGVLCW